MASESAQGQDGEPDGECSEGESDTYRLEEDRTVCQHCGYDHLNCQESQIHLNPGDYCPKCGEQFSEGDRQTIVEILEL